MDISIDLMPEDRLSSRNTHKFVSKVRLFSRPRIYQYNEDDLQFVSKVWLFSRPRIYQYNEDDLQFQFLIFTKLSTSMDTHKHGNKEKMSPIYTFFLGFGYSFDQVSEHHFGILQYSDTDNSKFFL